MNEAVEVDCPKPNKVKEKKESLLQKPQIDPSISIEKIQGQLDYAQKIINILQVKVNDANGVIVQLEARLQIANEDKENILKQVEKMGISPV
jgi:hypothetical protein